MHHLKIHKIIAGLILLLLPYLSYGDYIRGIYLTQYTFENTKTLNSLIKNAKEANINTFVVDMEFLSKRYDKNIQLLKDNNIRYVARVAIFPQGGTYDQVTSEKYWASKQELIKQAVALGAAEVQLDYIRYTTDRKQSDENAKDILKVINWFHQQLKGTKSELQIAVFGEACTIPSRAIGQNIQVFSQSIESMSPMVYPSHYYPFVFHSLRPYETIHESLLNCKAQFNNHVPFRLVPYIEIFNVRYHIPETKRTEYIYKEIKAVQDSNVDGWYAWSPNSKYEYLFKMLQAYHLNKYSLRNIISKPYPLAFKPLQWHSLVDEFHGLNLDIFPPLTIDFTPVVLGKLSGNSFNERTAK